MKRLFVVLLGALLLSACGQANAPPGSERPDRGSAATTNPENLGKKVSVPGGSFTRVSPAELRAMLEEKDFPLINVHVPFESNIPGTDLSIPNNKIGQNLDRLPADKRAKIVLYCRSGNMSSEAARTLVNLGYDNVWDLEGGMITWENAGFPHKGD